jgi:hypothetical protein
MCLSLLLSLPYIHVLCVLNIVQKVFAKMKNKALYCLVADALKFSKFKAYSSPVAILDRLILLLFLLS